MADTVPDRPLRAGVVVPAAGSGRRMGGVKKPFLDLLGVPVLERALAPFLADPRVTAVVVALSPEDAGAPPRWLTELDPRIRVCAGGETRSDSVRRGLAALPEDVDVVAVHDAARPFVTENVVGRCLDLAAAGFGAVAGTPAVDTIKRVDGSGAIVETPPREVLWHAQTPQVFPAAALRAAYARPGASGTDDAQLFEGSALAVRMVDAGPDNFKVTHPRDVLLAERILRDRSGDAAAEGERGPHGPDDLAAVVAHLRAGNPIAYPTETVYGLGGAVTAEAVARVQRLKARDAGRPLLILVDAPERVDGLEWTPAARALAEAFWPGPLTLVLRDPRGIFPEGVRSPETSGVGVRVSPHPLVQRLLAAYGAPITSTSLNAAGAPPARSGIEAAGVIAELGAKDVRLLDGGALPASAPSTVVDCTGETPRVLRVGSVPVARLRCVVPEIDESSDV